MLYIYDFCFILLYLWFSGRKTDLCYYATSPDLTWVKSRGCISRIPGGVALRNSAKSRIPGGVARVNPRIPGGVALRNSAKIREIAHPRWSRVGKSTHHRWSRAGKSTHHRWSRARVTPPLSCANSTQIDQIMAAHSFQVIVSFLSILTSWNLWGT